MLSGVQSRQSQNRSAPRSRSADFHPSDSPRSYREHPVQPVISLNRCKRSFRPDPTRSMFSSPLSANLRFSCQRPTVSNQNLPTAAQFTEPDSGCFQSKLPALSFPQVTEEHAERLRFIPSVQEQATPLLAYRVYLWGIGYIRSRLKPHAPMPASGKNA